MLTAQSNHIADFIEVRDYLNRILEDTETHVIIGYACGPYNSVNLKEKPHPDLAFRFNLEFVFREEANEEDLKNELKPYEDNRVPSVSPKSIMAALNLIAVDRQIFGSTQPSLIYISSETGMFNVAQKGRNQYTVSLMVNSIPADAFDNVSRLPINPDTLQGIVNIKDEDDGKTEEGPQYQP